MSTSMVKKTCNLRVDPIFMEHRGSNHSISQIGGNINETLTLSDRAEICFMAGFSLGPEAKLDS